LFFPVKNLFIKRTIAAEAPSETPPPQNTKVRRCTIEKKPVLIMKDILITYKNLSVLKWSIWSGMWIAVHHLVITYWQSLFAEIDAEKSKEFNGYMNAVSYLLAACCALIPTRIEKFIGPLSSAFLIVFPIINCFLLVGMAMSRHIFLNYAFYILYHSIYEFMGPIASVQIAKYMPTIRFGIVFSLNTTLAMLIQTIIQFTVGSKGLKLDIKNQFYFYATCLGSVGIAYAIGVVFYHVRQYYNRKQSYAKLQQ